MTVTNYALGQLNPVLYYENSTGEISLPPTTDDALRLKSQMLRRGFELHEAGTLSDIDALQKRMQDQELASRQVELLKSDTVLGDVRRQIRDRLVTRMVSSSCRPYERDFIAAYLQLRDDKREQYRKRFTADVSYFMAREFDGNHHISELVARVPDMADETCVKCGKYRRVKNTNLCLQCLGGGNGD